LKGVERYKKLYHYTSFDSFVKIWLSKSLKFSPVSNVNDIQEKVIEASIINPEQIELANSFIAIRKSFKQVSFTMDYDSYLKGSMSPMMWGLYADKTKGVCIELDYNKIQFPRNCLKGIVEYKAILNKYHGISPDIKTESDLNRFILKHQKELFFTKNKCWSGENEYRILSKENDFLNIENAISAVCLASFRSSELDLVRKLINGIIPIKIFTHDFALDNSAIPTLKDLDKILTSTSDNRGTVLL
jgi:hypothetical protein